MRVAVRFIWKLSLVTGIN